MLKYYFKPIFRTIIKYIITFLLIIIYFFNKLDNENYVNNISYLHVKDGIFEIIKKKGNNVIVTTKINNQNINLLLYCKSCNYIKGDILSFSGTIIPIESPIFRKSYNPREYYKEYNINNIIIAKSKIILNENSPQYIYQLRHHIISKIKNNTNNPIAISLLIGDRLKIEKEDYQKYQNIGITHLFAISGLHIGGIYLTFFFIFRKILSLFNNISLRYNNKKISSLLSLIISFLFLFIVNFPISGQRAFLFLIILTFGILVNIRIEKINILLLTILILLILNPSNLFMPGFQLSFSAIIGIIFYTKISKSSDILQKNKSLNLLLVSLVIMIFTQPFIIYYFGNSSLISPIANLIAIPLVSIIILPFAIFSVFSIFLGISDITFSILDYLINILQLYASFISKYAILTPSILIIDEISLFLVLLSFTIILISSSYRLYYAALSLYLIAYITPYFAYKSDLIITPYNKFFIALDNYNYMANDRKISSYRKYEIKKNIGNIELINTYEYSGKNLYCKEHLCLYHKNNHFIAIILKKISSNKMRKLCNNNIIVDYANNINLCKNVFYINSYHLQKKGTLSFLFKNKIRIRNI